MILVVILLHRYFWSVFCRTMKPSTIVVGNDSLISSVKVKKNAAEIYGMKRCHLQDGAALVEFLCWLEDEVSVHHRTFSEVEIDEHLQSFRSQMSSFHQQMMMEQWNKSEGTGKKSYLFNPYLGPSFPTIAGVNENAAIVHYR